MFFANIFTSAIVTEFVQWNTLSQRSIHTGDHFHVTKHSIPPRRALTFELVLRLLALGSVEARRRLAPVDIVFTSLPSVAVGAVTFVVANQIDASCPVFAGTAVAFVNGVLTI